MCSRQIVSSVGGDDEPEMRKEVGCMTGIFQLLDRHHWNKKLLTQGGHHNMEPRSSITKMKKEKTMPEGVKGKQILSDQSSKIYPSSPTPSNLSSSSSSLGRYKTPQLESEFPKTPKNRHRQSPDLQDVVRELMQREARSVSVGKLHLLKRIDSPRPLKPEEDIPRAPPRFSCDGTESLERLKATTVKLKDIPRLSLDSGLRSIKRSADQDSGCHKTSPASVVAKLMGLEGFPDNSVPIINHSFFPAQKDTVFGEIEKRVSELEFKKSGKDLRALKQILEKMHNTRLECQKQNGNTKVEREDSVNKGRAKLASKRNSVKEPSRYVPSIEKKNNRRTSKSVLENNHMQVRSPARLQHKKHGNNKQSCDSSRVRKHQNKQPKPGPSKMRLKAKEMNQAEWLGDDTTMTEFAMATTEQPSPVSVLDSAFFIENSPSPVKKISTAFRDYELEDSNEAEWHTEDLVHHHEKLVDIQHPIYKLSISNTDHEDSINQIESLCQSDNLDHQYINKIILASGILKDLDCLSTTKLHQSGNLINPELFHVVEQTEDSVRPSNGENNFDKKSNRKLIFDTVNEILVQKLNIKGSLMPKRRFLSGQQLLKEIYAEIDYLQAKPNSSLVIEDDKLVSILNADMKHESEGWEKQHCEIAELVLSIERLIFKDLVSEVIRGDVIERSRGHCRQLFTRQ